MQIICKSISDTLLQDQAVANKIHLIVPLDWSEGMLLYTQSFYF